MTIFSKKITSQYNIAHVKISQNTTLLEVYPFNLDVKNTLAILDVHKINQNYSNSTLYFTIAKYSSNQKIALYQTSFSTTSHISSFYKFINADEAFLLNSGGITIKYIKESGFLNI